MTSQHITIIQWLGLIISVIQEICSTISLCLSLCPQMFMKSETPDIWFGKTGSVRRKEDMPLQTFISICLVFWCPLSSKMGHSEMGICIRWDVCVCFYVISLLMKCSSRVCIRTRVLHSNLCMYVYVCIYVCVHTSPF